MDKKDFFGDHGFDKILLVGDFMLHMMNVFLMNAHGVGKLFILGEEEKKEIEPVKNNDNILGGFTVGGWEVCA